LARFFDDLLRIIGLGGEGYVDCSHFDGFCGLFDAFVDDFCSAAAARLIGCVYGGPSLHSGSPTTIFCQLNPGIDT
jgi:hypothetical protein